MKTLEKLGIALTITCALMPGFAAAELRRAVSDIGPGHEVAARWGSAVPGHGAAYMLFDPEAGEIIELVMRIDGVPPETLAAVGPEGRLGAIHIHNYPQGGPDFFVQQLPGTITATDTGFEFRLETWLMEDPLVGPEGGAAFVLSEVMAGNAYFGMHTTDALCPANQKPGIETLCKAPATALSGHLRLLPAPDPALMAMMATR